MKKIKKALKNNASETTAATNEAKQQMKKGKSLVYESEAQTKNQDKQLSHGIPDHLEFLDFEIITKIEFYF